MITSTDYIARVKAYGQADESYLQWHAQRIVMAQALFDQRHGQAGSCRILDIGAHWLYQSLLYALSGHNILRPM